MFHSNKNCGSEGYLLEYILLQSIRTRGCEEFKYLTLLAIIVTHLFHNIGNRLLLMSHKFRYQNVHKIENCGRKVQIY